MHSYKRLIVVLVVALAAVPVFAADLVTVTTEVTYSTAHPDGANEGTVLITNNTNADVRVRLDMSVVYADGTVQRLTGISDPGVLPPGGGFYQSVYFVVPGTAALGPARFVADVSAVSGGQQENESTSAPFEVVP